MRILYSAIDQSVPAPHGGAVHVTSVAEGLAALGHDVHVFVSPGNGGAIPSGHATWSALPPPMGLRRLRLLRSPQLIARARAWKPDVVIERYYNFGGEGMLAAKQIGALGVLEVNAPVVDLPGSSKELLDRLLIVRPLQRWREWLCRSAGLIVTPSVKIIPADVPAERIFKTEWGADTERFQPRSAAAAGASPVAALRRTPSDTVAIFVGAFRAWHGAIHLVDAIRRLQARGRTDVRALFVGEGPELSRVRSAAAGLSGVAFTGAVAHDAMPPLLASADVGVAPFEVSGHRSLAHEFYWSPLKIFEYMATGLPVVAPRLQRITEIVEDGREGLLYDSSNPDALTNALERLTDAALRSRLGSAARRRAVDEFSWQSHCARLDAALRAALQRSACGS
jgi:glycosyltransferase involved in cell wall biosynthesis